MIITGKVYDVLKVIALIYLPAIGSLYFGLDPFWHFPKVEEITGTILVIDTVLGGLLGISSSQYNKTKTVGTATITVNDEGKKIVELEPDGDPYDWDQKSEIVFKVKKA